MLQKHILGIGTVDVQPLHHRQVALHCKVAHGIDCVIDGNIGIAYPTTLNISNIVGIESNKLKIGTVHSSLVNPGVPHLLSRRLVILDRPAGFEESPTFEVGFRTAVSASIDGDSHPGGRRHGIENLNEAAPADIG